MRSNKIIILPNEFRQEETINKFINLHATQMCMLEKDRREEHFPVGLLKTQITITPTKCEHNWYRKLDDIYARNQFRHLFIYVLSLLFFTCSSVFVNTVLVSVYVHVLLYFQSHLGYLVPHLTPLPSLYLSLFSLSPHVSSPVFPTSPCISFSASIVSLLPLVFIKAPLAIKSNKPYYEKSVFIRTNNYCNSPAYIVANASQ